MQKRTVLESYFHDQRMQYFTKERRSHDSFNISKKYPRIRKRLKGKNQKESRKSSQEFKLVSIVLVKKHEKDTQITSAVSALFDFYSHVEFGDRGIWSHLYLKAFENTSQILYESKAL